MTSSWQARKKKNKWHGNDGDNPVFCVKCRQLMLCISCTLNWQCSHNLADRCGPWHASRVTFVAPDLQVPDLNKNERHVCACLLLILSVCVTTEVLQPSTSGHRMHTSMHMCRWVLSLKVLLEDTMCAQSRGPCSMDVQSKALRHAQHCQGDSCPEYPELLSLFRVSADSGLDQVPSACAAFINLRRTFTGVYSNAAWFLA